MSIDIDRIIPVAGDGLVARWSSGTVVLGGSAGEVRATLAGLRPTRDDPSADELVERLRSAHVPHLAAIVVVPGGRRLICRGSGAAIGLDTGSSILGAGSTETREALAPSEPLWLGFGPIPFDRQDLDDGPVSLGSGVVTGRGVLLEPATPVPGAPTPEPVVEPFELADLSPDRTSAPLPIADPPPRGPNDEEGPLPPGGNLVQGIECSRGHFNNPSAAYCSSCGISLVHLTHRLVRGERPALGFLVFDDGSTFTLDRSYLIGRDPDPDPTSGLTPLGATDAEQSVSRSHAELVLDDWEVRLCDLGSTNGTFIWREEQHRWESVLPNRPVVVDPGARMAVGRRTFVYESLARSV